MKEQTLKSWEEFEEKIVEINQCARVLQQQEQLSRMECPLFRGHSDSGWSLESTLDRIQKGMSYSRYLEIIKAVREHVATCTGRKWDLETNEPKMHLGGFDLPLSTYEFMAYLRHNKFPSPLIDWTKSPYIAAFFAFGDVYSKAEHVSIFAYRGDIMHGGNPSMWILGPSIKTSRTHYLQQSEYSMCFREENGEKYFATHEDVEEDVEEQDVLIKYTIPVSERTKVIRKLDSMNITAYSLFDSEPSLMETLALRELFLK
jgi:hypothetical protein